MADLQMIVVDDDALDHELYDCLLVGERCGFQAPVDAFAERRQVGEDFLRLGALAA